MTVIFLRLLVFPLGRKKASLSIVLIKLGILSSVRVVVGNALLSIHKEFCVVSPSLGRSSKLRVSSGVSAKAKLPMDPVSYTHLTLPTNREV